MRYISTRGQAPPVSFLDAVLAGMAPDGGLYVPESWPQTLNNERFRKYAALGSFHGVATQVLAAFWPDSGGPDVEEIPDAAYGNRRVWPEAVTPLVQIGPGDWMLELFHGPSLSFKDVAMQLIGPLYERALARRGEKLAVVCATSGDTGGAAVEAIKGSALSDLFVLMPKGRVSDVQTRFMTASGAANVHALDIDGDFDACQSIVKSLFADVNFAERAHLSGVNSINWARIVAQSVYFHIAANTLSAAGPVNFVVPTGNFGDAFSGYVAKRMGAPIGKIVLATNTNDILWRTLKSGRYEREPHSHATLSPAMDIQIASNFERIAFEAADRSSDAVRRHYEQFLQGGGFDLTDTELAFLQAHFEAYAVSDEETVVAMQELWNGGGQGVVASFDGAHPPTASAQWIGGDHSYLACPHTSVGFYARRHVNLQGPVVTLATAHPAKFPETVERATGVRPQLPAKCADLFQRSEKFDSLPADAEAVKQYIRERSRAWQ